MNKVIELIKKTRWVYNTLVKIYFTGYKIIFNLFKIIFSLKTKVVFQSFNGKQYSCNPRAISETLHKLNPNLDILWVFNDPQSKRNIVPNYVRIIKKNSFQEIFHMATAKVWVDNVQKPLYFKPRKNQFYIQTWHGDRGFKKILYDVRTRLTNGKYKEGNLLEEKYCDLMTVGSNFGEKKLRSAFGFNGSLLKYGSPRNDVLVKRDNKEVEKIKKQLGIYKQTKILLFAPTFRKYSRGGSQKTEIDIPEIINTLEKKYDNDWICLVRAHSASKGLLIKAESNKIIDVSKYEDMADLLLITDMLITDYSSSAGDFILTNKPLILFQPDREQYIKEERNLYFDLENAPFLVAKTNKELIDLIESLNNEMIKENCEDIKKFYGIYETGEASKRTAQYITEKMKN